NAFFQVEDKELTQFLDAIASLQSEDDYAQLVTTYGVRRTQPGFWKVSDELNAQYRAQSPREAGIFDLNRYENR
ncbi:MAG: peptidylprolyl isomerase, partial [Halieaceae bacterium]|nr:peptidylprolyl isomerase [Halieaceae bacterium]